MSKKHKNIDVDALKLAESQKEFKNIIMGFRSVLHKHFDLVEKKARHCIDSRWQEVT